MISRSWPAAVAVIAVLALVPAPALAARTHHVTRGLDYLHSQQVPSTGGFGKPTATAFAMLGAVATGERVSSKAWTHGGKNPVRSLQALNQEAAAAATSNAPLYYAQMIMAYLAAGHEGYVYDAGTGHIDLLAKLQSYQDTSSASGNSSYGSYSPSSSNRSYQAVRTTCWAIMAQHALRIDTPNFQAAVAWLQAQPSFGLDAGDPSDTIDTALAVQALRAGHVDAGAAPIPGALSFLKSVQLHNGGFPDQRASSAVASSQATAYAIQAIRAAGERPSDSTWQASGGGPLDALAGMQVKRGAYAERGHTLIDPVTVTGNVLVALSQQAFATYPLNRPPAVKAFVYKPAFTTLRPKDKTTFKTTHIVLIRTLYGDGAGGTGINAKAVRLSVDNVDKTKAAAVSSHGLHLELKNVPNGAHTYVITLRDFAGNTRTATRSFTVAVPVPVITPTPTHTPTLPLPTFHATPSPTPTPITTPTAVTPTTPTTLYPSPTTSSSAFPVTPSASSSPISGAPVTGPSPGAGGGATPGGGSGSTAGFLGGTLLAMLPLGAALSYYLLYRRETAMAGSVVGEKLAGGGTGWDKLKNAFARTKDLVKPARS
jgi:hypothetical protein